MDAIKIILKTTTFVVSILFMTACSMEASIVNQNDQDQIREILPDELDPDNPSTLPSYKNPDFSSGETVVTEQGSPGYVIKSSLYKISEGEMLSSAYRIQAIVD